MNLTNFRIRKYYKPTYVSYISSGIFSKAMGIFSKAMGIFSKAIGMFCIRPDETGTMIKNVENHMLLSRRNMNLNRSQVKKNLRNN